MLLKVIELWKSTSFRLVPHGGDIHILAGADDILALLEESQVTIGTIRGSRYVTPIKVRHVSSSHRAHMIECYRLLVFCVLATAKVILECVDGYVMWCVVHYVIMRNEFTIDDSCNSTLNRPFREVLCLGSYNIFIMDRTGPK